MELSDFGEKFTSRSGILDLMDDLSQALQGTEKKYMLGGGNPALIPSVTAVFRRRVEEILTTEGGLETMLGNYDSACANAAFAESLSSLLKEQFGWPVGPENIAVTNGSQAAFFLLFNLFGGRKRGKVRRVVFPLCPEYIGYADQGLDPEQFISFPSRIEELSGGLFKYHVDFDHLEIPSNAAALCVSRPTNPTGNVLSDAEVRKLAALAEKQGIPLFLDNAYGLPFPRIIFEEVHPYWDENVVYSMSLSKLGLPSVRTGIIIARKEIIQALAAANAIVNLANGGIGQILVEPLIRSGEILRISKEWIYPFYRERSAQTTRWIQESFPSHLEYRIHKSQGAIFLWVWFKNLRIRTKELYEKLKKRNVIVVPGEYFFFGLQEEWDHRFQCIRLNYSGREEDVKRGIEIIAETAGAATR
ncbi:MAG TPA: valine--pyruvate transaminase [Spirochaetales bacterium]|nr:valine--pyruvate transaminase [Spirochaetales bacterium]